MEQETTPNVQVVLELVAQMDNISADVANSLRGTCPICGNPMATSFCSTC